MNSPQHPADTGGEIYSLETVEQITRLSRDRIVLYQRYGLVKPVQVRDGVYFDDRAVLQLRRIAFLLSEYGVNETGVRHIAALFDEVERLREELRFLRG
jgi:DNA-binding transcriptional MerR regulator